MARTIPASTTVPASTVFSGRPVVSDVSGPKAVRDAAMAHYERGSVDGVADYKLGGLISDKTHTAEWRAPCRPLDDLTRPWVVTVRGESAAGCVVTVSSVRTTDTVDLTLGAGRVEGDGLVTGTLDVEHSDDYETFKIEFKTFTAGSKITEIAAYPERAGATLAALSGATAPNGVTALDERYEDGHPLSTARWDDVCTMLEDGYGRAAGSVLTVARQTGDLDLAKGERAHRIYAEVPQTADGRAVTLAIHYMVQGAVRVSCDTAQVDLPSSPSAWATGSLSVSGAVDGATRPCMRMITLERIGTDIAVVRRISAWWTGVDASDAPQGDPYDPITYLVDEDGDPILDEFGEFILV